MSTILKLIILVIVIIIVVVGIWWWYASSNHKQTIPAVSTTSNLKTTQNAPTNVVTSPNDTSDAGLSNDLSAIDSQMNGLNTDSVNVDQSLNQ